MRHDRPVPVVFFFGAMSPYSWLSAERIGSLIPHAQWQGIFAGGIFKLAGRVSWGSGDHRAAGIAECEARARAYGLGEISWPDPWPTTDLTVARALLLAQARGLLQPFALGAMRMAFKEGADLAEAGAVLEAGRRAGIEADELAAALHAPETKSALRVATEQTRARGVFGVPTFTVGEQLFWGDDRLGEAAAAAEAVTATTTA
jgi:2-hydroxychromene-2-carboxylate isomerase